MFKTPTIGYVEVLGKMVIVVLDQKECEKEGADGLFDDRILLKEYYENKQHFKQTLMHEIIHAVCQELGCQLDDHMEETLAHTVSSVLSGVDFD